MKSLSGEEPIIGLNRVWDIPSVRNQLQHDQIVELDRNLSLMKEHLSKTDFGLNKESGEHQFQIQLAILDHFVSKLIPRLKARLRRQIYSGELDEHVVREVSRLENVKRYIQSQKQISTDHKRFKNHTEILNYAWEIFNDNFCKNSLQGQKAKSDP